MEYTYDSKKPPFFQVSTPVASRHPLHNVEGKRRRVPTPWGGVIRAAIRLDARPRASPLQT